MRCALAGDPARRTSEAGVEDIVRLGRNYGIGSTLVSQRPQSVSKEVLSQAECLVVHRLVGPHERRAVRDWIVDRDAPRDALDDLPSLALGEAFAWSPQWLDFFGRVRIAAKRTWDGSATPVFGETNEAPPLPPLRRTAALDALIAAAEGESAGDGSAEHRGLRARVAELERRLRERPVRVETREIRVETPAPGPDVRKRLQALDRRFAAVGREAKAAQAEIAEIVALGADAGDAEPPAGGGGPPAQGERRAQAPGAAIPDGEREQANGAFRLTDYQRSLLRSIAQSPGASYPRVALRATRSHGSSTFRNALSGLRKAGLVRGGRQGLQATPAGLAVDGVPGEPLPDGRALVERWARTLGRSPHGNARSSILRALLEAHPLPLTAGDIERRTARGGADGYSARSSTMRNALSDLRRLGLAEGSAARGGVRIAAACGL